MRRTMLWMAVAGVLSTAPGCGTHVNAFNSTPKEAKDSVVEGTLFSVSYDLGGGRVGGLSRGATPETVPGGNGSWNVDARAVLTDRFLIITDRSHSQELGPLVIPVERLYSVQFGDGGVQFTPKGLPTRNENHDSNHHH